MSNIDGLGQINTSYNNSSVSGNSYLNAGNTKESIFSKVKLTNSEGKTVKLNYTNGEKPKATLTAEQVANFDTKERKVDGEKTEIKIAPDGNAYALNESTGKYELLAKTKSGNIFHKAQYTRSPELGENEDIDEGISTEDTIPDSKAEASESDSEELQAAQANQTVSPTPDTPDTPDAPEAPDTSVSKRSSKAGNLSDYEYITDLGENADPKLKAAYDDWKNMTDEEFNKKMDEAQKGNGFGSFTSSTVDAAHVKKLFGNFSREQLNQAFGEDAMKELLGDNNNTLSSADEKKLMGWYMSQVLGSEGGNVAGMAYDPNTNTVRMLMPIMGYLHTDGD